MMNLLRIGQTVILAHNRKGGKTIGVVMLLLVSAFPLNVLAQVCCPSGCVQDGASCVTAGANPRSCGQISCTQGSGNQTSGGGNGGGSKEVVILPIHGPLCFIDQPPRGSYQQSCQQIVWDCKVLRASCNPRSGQAQQSTLPDPGSCVTDIANMDGQLHCSRGIAPPPGSYAESCRDIFVESELLHAECRHSDGQWTTSQPLAIRACGNGIDNQEGTLRCK